MYRLIVSEADWPDDLDRTLSTHADFGDAMQALDAQLDAHRCQLAANDEGTASLHLSVVDDDGHQVGTGSILSRTDMLELNAAARARRATRNLARPPGW